MRQLTDEYNVINGKSSSSSVGGEKYAELKWDELGFSLTPTDFMYVMQCTKGQYEFSEAEGRLLPYANIQLSPSSSILNYGQACTPTSFIFQLQLQPLHPN